MKKIILSFVIILVSFAVMAQDPPQSTYLPGGGSRTANTESFECMPGSVFSQIHPQSYADAYFETGFDYFPITDDYTATGPFSTLRFWATDWNGCPMGTTEMFDIKIYNGNPSSGGVVVNSFLLPGTTTATGVLSWGSSMIYQIDVNLGIPVTQLNGWISIAMQNNGNSCIGGWCFENGGNAMSYYVAGGYWQSTGYSLFFCLGSGAPTPVSGWALGIGLLLIAAFTVLRIRKS